MKKLTEAQEKILQKIFENLKLHKESKDALDLYLKENLKGTESRPDYEDLKNWYTQKYYTYKEEIDNTYGKWIKKAKEENIVLATGNTSTLKALEKAGYIKIVEVGGIFPDEVKVVKESD